jgi:hypothetical protein
MEDVMEEVNGFSGFSKVPVITKEAVEAQGAEYIKKISDQVISKKEELALLKKEYDELILKKKSLNVQIDQGLEERERKVTEREEELNGREKILADGISDFKKNMENLQKEIEGLKQSLIERITLQINEIKR